MLLLATAATAATLTSGSLFSLTILELVTGLVFVLGLALGAWKMVEGLKTDLHSSLEKHTNNISNSMKEFEDRLVSQIRDEIKYSVTLTEAKQEARLNINESKIASHETELRELREVKYRMQTLEQELASLKHRVEAIEASE
jgi:hypothetical protein